jgi:hypothetical protein
MNRNEPLDNIIPVEKPYLLKQAMTMIVEHGVVAAPSIIEELSLSQEDVEALSGLESGYFSPVGKVIQLDFKKKF